MVTDVLRNAQNIVEDSVDEANVKNDSVDMMIADNSVHKEYVADKVSSHFKILVLFRLSSSLLVK